MQTVLNKVGIRLFLITHILNRYKVLRNTPVYALFSFRSVQRIVLQLSRDFNADYQNDEIELIYIYIYIYKKKKMYWLQTLKFERLVLRMIHAYFTRKTNFVKNATVSWSRSNAFPNSCCNQRKSQSFSFFSLIDPYLTLNTITFGVETSGKRKAKDCQR